jgi:putative PIN family toxin of toxin-antitoxin system
MRAVLDPNVVVSALLSPTGAPAHVLRAWIDGACELIVSRALLGELERVLACPTIAERVTESEAAEVIALLRHGATQVDDPSEGPSTRTPDPDDDYLVALAEHARAMLVSGDKHLLGLGRQLPVASPRAFLDSLDPQG